MPGAWWDERPAKQTRVARVEIDGRIARIQVPVGTRPEDIPAIARQVIRVEDVVPRPDKKSALDMAGDIATNLTNGLAFLPDAMVQVGDSLRRATGEAGAFLVTGGGAARDPGTVRIADTIRQWGQQRTPTMRSINQRLNPDAANAPSAFAAEFLGGALVPIGPKIPKTRVPIPTPPVPARAASRRAIPRAADVISEGARRGVRVMTTDVRPPRTALGKKAQSFAEQIPIVGTGRPRAAQQVQRVEAVKATLREFGGDDAVRLFDDAPSAIDDVASNLTAKRGRDLTRLTAAKRSVIEGIDGVVPPSNTLAAIDKQIADLTARATPTSLDVAARLKALRPSFEGKTLAQLEAMRADELGSVFKGDNLAHIKDVGEKAMRAIYDPLRKDMGAFIRSQGGNGAFNKWAVSNQKLAGMAGELDSAALKSALRTADLTPENVGKLLFSRKRSDVARLVQNLDEFGKSRARAAVLQRAFDKAVSADGGLSVERFVNNVTSLGDQVGVLFKGPDKAQIEGLTRLLDATRRAAGASVAPPTGAQNTPIIGGIALTQLAGLWGGTALAGAGGVLARAYESAPVRNLLIGLSKSKPGSKTEAAIITRLATGMLAAARNTEGAVARAANENVGVRAAAGNRPEDQNEQQGPF